MMDSKSELEDFKTNLLDEQHDNNRDRILSVIVIYMLCSFLFFRTIPMIYEGWYSLWIWPYINFVLSVIWSFIPLMIARQLKNEKTRQTTVIFGFLYLIISLGFAVNNIITSIF